MNLVSNIHRSPDLIEIKFKIASEVATAVVIKLTIKT
jgi:hypothetical protein